MLILKTLGLTCLVSMTAILIMFMWLAVKSSVFFDRDERYYKVTMGNPLNAAFDESLLTEKGLQWRALIGKVQIVIWIGFVVVAFIEWLFVS